MRCAIDADSNEEWPQPLRVLLPVMRNSRQPMFVAWGAQRALFYNDAYGVLLGGRHPAARGRPFFEVWPEVRNDIVPLMDRVFAGESLFMDDIRLRLERNGYPEEAHFSFSYTPVRDGDGAVAGLFCACHETTEQVRVQRALQDGEARQAFRVELIDSLRSEREPETIMAIAADRLGRHLGATCVGYGEIDASGEWVRVGSDWTAPGARSVVGLHRLASFGPTIIDELRAGRTVTVADTAADPRTSGPTYEPAYAGVGARALINAPRMKDGKLAVVVFVLSAEPRRWTDKEQALVEDVAERTWAAIDNRRIEDSLRESEARFRTVAQAMPGFVWTADARGELDYTSPRWHAYSGTDAMQSQGAGWKSFVHGDDQAGALSRWAHAIATRTPYETEFRLRRADGVYRWWLARALPSADAVSAAPRWVGVCTDLDEIVAAREALSRSREDLERLIEQRTRERNRVWENSRDLLVVLGADGIVREVSPAWTAILGHRPSDVVGRSFLEFIHPDDAARTRGGLDDAAARRDLTNFESRFLHQDGTARHISWHSSTDGDLVYAFGRDITAEKTQAAALREAENQLRQAQKMEAVGKLTGGVAHDFNNILQVISGNLQLIARYAAADDKVLRRAVNAQAAVSRGARLSGQLLAFSRRQALEPKVVSAGRLVTAMDDMLRRALGEHIEIEIRVAGGLWNAFVDPGQIEDAVLNLAINGRDAMAGGGKLTIEVGNVVLDDLYARSHAEVAAGQYVLVAVSDTGIGMTADVVAQAFEPFFSTKPMGKGTGLGLSMVYGFARQSGGHVKIYSEPGSGTTVRLYLPFAPEGEEQLAENRGESIPEGSETILVAEDDEAVRDTVIDLLGELGYRVLAAHDAASALAIVEAGAPVDLLFTDVVMPGELKSPELATKVRALRPKIAVLFTSGYTDNAIVHGGRLDAGIELLTKPYTRGALARKLRQVLASAS